MARLAGQSNSLSNAARIDGAIVVGVSAMFGMTMITGMTTTPTIMGGGTARRG